jgi:hypothetical protein
VYHQQFQQYMQQMAQQQEMEKKLDYERRSSHESAPRQRTSSNASRDGQRPRLPRAHTAQIHSMHEVGGYVEGGILPRGRDLPHGFHRDIVPTNPTTFVSGSPLPMTQSELRAYHANATRPDTGGVVDHRAFSRTHLDRRALDKPTDLSQTISLRTQQGRNRSQRNASSSDTFAATQQAQPQRATTSYGTKPLSYYTGRGVPQSIANPRVYASFVNKQRSVARTSDIDAVAALAH